MALLPELNVDTAQMAELINRVSAMSNKFNGGIDFLEETINKVQAESEQSIVAKDSYKKIIDESREGIIPKTQHCQSVLDEFRQQIIDIEGDDSLFQESIASRSEVETSTRSKLRGSR